MLHNATFSGVFVTIYLVAYCIMLQVPALLPIAEAMLLFSPVLILWMVFTVLKHGKHNNTELNSEEFGYQDKNKNELGIF